jgi:hypothetical protein
MNAYRTSRGKIHIKREAIANLLMVFAITTAAGMEDGTVPSVLQVGHPSRHKMAVATMES